MAYRGQHLKLEAGAGRYQTAQEIGRLLKRRRESKDLTIAELAHQLGIDASKLMALEAGRLEAFDGQLQVLAALRAYAKKLKLDADQMALALIDSWSIDDSARFAPQGSESQISKDTELTKSTAEVPLLAPAEARPSTPRRTRTPRVPLPYKVMFFISVFLVLAAGIGNLLEHVHPQWFRSLERPVLSPTTLAGSSSSSASSPSTTSPSSSSSTTSIAGAGQVYTVSANSFSLRIAAQDLCWAEVTSLNGGNVLFANELQPGQYTQLTGLKAVTAQLGSSSCELQVINGTKVLYQIQPTSAPATYTIKTTSS